MSTRIALRPAGPAAELDYVERLLAASDLPTRDVRDKPDAFYVAVAAGEPVGVGGVETFGPAGLLRSVAVEDAVRGEGYGTALCEELETRARAEGVDELFLLTTTAREFFADRGYRAVDRDDAPERIRSTTEFRELCPESAACMAKRLGE